VLELGTLAFATPWMLAALALLPLLWWFLRVTPPAPKSIRFPAIRLLFGLVSREKTPASSPLWLILLRLAAAAILILALAHPLMNPGAQLPGQGPLLLIVDDGWASAPNWPLRQRTMLQALARAEREDRGVMLLTTAPSTAGQPPSLSGVLKPAEARGLVEALQPKPWPDEREAALKSLANAEPNGDMPVLWLSNSLRDDTTARFAEALEGYGPVQVLLDSPERLPHVLLPPEASETMLSVRLLRSGKGYPEKATVRARAHDGRLLARENAEFLTEDDGATVQFELPVEMRNEVTRLDIRGENSAAAVVLLDERWRRRPVGVASSKTADSNAALLSESYYIERALRPFTDIRFGPVGDLVKQRRAVIVLPDAYAPDPGDADALAQWIEAGGLVLRFAGLNLARNDADELVPVRLRRGGRALGGALLWSKPARLAPFSKASPLHGLDIPDDVTISRQVLAEPTLDLAEKTWARLTDGTPLVTAERRGRGRLVLIHTSANTTWTNLPISGLYVDMLRRITATSRGVAQDQSGDRPLQPLELLDGFGQPAKGAASATAIAAGAFAKAKVGPSHPPGFYGVAETRQALNLSPQIKDWRALTSLPQGMQQGYYTEPKEIDLKPWLIVLTLLLLLADIVATLALRGLLRDALAVRQFANLSRLVRRGAIGALGVLTAALMLMAGLDASAQEGASKDRFAVEASSATRLAYVVTGIHEVDDVSRAGLTGLSNVLNQRTAVEAGVPIGVDIAEDEIAFFSLIYWPVTDDQPAPDAATVTKLNRFLENGGTILFDTRDQSRGGGGPGQQARALRRLTRGLNLPPLEPVPPDHVLTKAFYLMQDFPGRWAGGRLWVERGDARTNDGVSRIVTGSHDWAAAWAIDDAGRPLFAVVPGGERQREMAYRFGVNLVMYTLTGNYKSDQVHVPAILERLGQ
jgi:hypothetical protein